MEVSNSSPWWFWLETQPRAPFCILGTCCSLNKHHDHWVPRYGPTLSLPQSMFPPRALWEVFKPSETHLEEWRCFWVPTLYELPKGEQHRAHEAKYLVTACQHLMPGTACGYRQLNRFSRYFTCDVEPQVPVNQNWTMMLESKELVQKVPCDRCSWTILSLRP